MIKDLDSLFRSLNLSLLIEGYPYANGLSKEGFTRLQSAVLPLSEKVKRIADTLDYKATRASGGYVFTKRYSHPNDLPVLTESEIKTIIKNIDSTFQKFGLGNERIDRMTPDMYAIVTFYKGLSVTQKNTFMSTGINFQNLPQEQQNLIERLLLDSYFSSILAGCFQAKVIFSETETSQVYIQGKQAISSFYRVKNIATRPLFPPNQVPKEFQQPVPPKWPEGYTKAPTLEDYLEKSKRKIQVDATLREKPLLVLGKECDDNQFLAMLSAFCPHQATRSGDRVTISAKPLPQTLDFQQIAASVLPETLRRYLSVPIQVGPDVSKIAPMVNVTDYRKSVFPPAGGAVVEKEIVEELGKSTVPFAKLSAFQRRCMMLRLLNPIVEGLIRPGGSVPSYVSQRHQTLIKGQVYSAQGRSWLQITFAVPEGPLGAPRVRLTMAQIPLPE